MKLFLTLIALLCLLLDPAWSGQGKEVNILIEKNAAGEDVIELNGERINMSKELDHLGVELDVLVKGLRSLDGEVQLELLRDDQQISVSLIAGRREDHLRSGLKHLENLEKNMLHRHEQHLGTSLDGVELYPLDKELGSYFGSDSGMLVLHAPMDKNLPIQSGDVILQIGERSPASPSQTWRILHSYDKGESIRLTLMRQGEQITVNLDKP